MATAESSIVLPSGVHAHLSPEICPLCEQPIPMDKLVQIQQRERERAAAHAKQLREEFAREKSQALALKQSEIDRLREEGLATAERAESDARNREASARASALREGALALASAKTAFERTTLQLESANAEHARIQAALQEQLARERDASAQRQAAAREEARLATEKEMRERLDAAELAKRAAEERLKNVRVEEQSAANDRMQAVLAEQRESMERDKITVVQAEQSKAFLERQKIEAELARLQRQVRKERADEIGEKAEIKLLDELRGNFPKDLFRPIDKGVAGADLWQDVVDEGVSCGRIVLDSKSRERWAFEYADKLKTDQLNAEGDFAVLATRAFPSGKSQLHVHNGVILAHPARVVAVVSMLRDHLIQARTLKLSIEERETKTAALYEFVNSKRCQQIFEHHETLLATILELDVEEKRTHDKVWGKRGDLIKKAQRAISVQLRGEIARIVEGGE